MVKKIAVLGSTGSIGVQTLDVARNLNIQILGLTGNSNIELLEKQIEEFSPLVVSVENQILAEKLLEKIKGSKTKVYFGQEGLLKVSTISETDTVVVAVSGCVGLIPTLEAIRNKKNIALANKETLVSAGSIVMSEVKKHKVRMTPIDSEHSAVLQCMEGNRSNRVEKIILTASGGPFRNKSIDQLKHVTLEQALNHPNWKMGHKITIDSATLMNKGLEVIEAKWLFDIEPENISVVVHPQSIIHSMVEFTDGCVMAQMGSPDMRIPIQYALTYPERYSNEFSKLDFTKMGALTFQEPDYDAFPCLSLAYQALKAGGTMPAVMNSANDEVVKMFLNNLVNFLDIPRIIEKVMKKHEVIKNYLIEDVIKADVWARNQVAELINEGL